MKNFGEKQCDNFKHNCRALYQSVKEFFIKIFNQQINGENFMVFHYKKLPWTHGNLRVLPKDSVIQSMYNNFVLKILFWYENYRYSNVSQFNFKSTFLLLVLPNRVNLYITFLRYFSWIKWRCGCSYSL